MTVADAQPDNPECFLSRREKMEADAQRWMEERESIDQLNRWIYGSEYEPDPLRRYVRAHGGHCSGGGGPS